MSYNTDVPALYPAPGFRYTYYIDDNNVYVTLTMGDCFKILASPIKILVTYEE